MMVIMTVFRSDSLKSFLQVRYEPGLVLDRGKSGRGANHKETYNAVSQPRAPCDFADLMCNVNHITVSRVDIRMESDLRSVFMSNRSCSLLVIGNLALSLFARHLENQKLPDSNHEPT